MMPTTVVQVDAFTNQAFRGNPAAVCVTSQPLAEGLMQSIALEMNLSETAFLFPVQDGFRLRWFTPTVEVDLCGHATLAAAHVLWSEGYLAATQLARFQTKSGDLTAIKQGDWIELNFPAQPVQGTTVGPHLIAALNHADIQGVFRNETNYLVELRSQQAVKTLKPDFSKLATLHAQGVIVTSQSDGSPYDFTSRYFAPAAGIPEDPVTGSAHCSLAPYWQAKLGKSEMFAYQDSARCGILKVRCEQDRVYIIGQAITVLRGELLI